MRKEALRKIVKTVKKEGSLKGVTFNPNLSECEFLQKNGIAITKSLVTRCGLISDCSYTVDTCDFVLDK